MKHVVIDKCVCNHEWCGLNTDNFLFYHNFRFYLVTSNPCLGINDLTSRERVIEQCIGKVSHDRYIRIAGDITNRADLGDSFKEYRLRGLSLERYVDEVNLIYRPIGRGNSCVTSKFKYIDLALGQEELKKNYEKAKEYLSKNGFESKIDSFNGLNKLYEANRIWDGWKSELQTVKAVDNLIKTIRDDIKSKSEHQSVV